MRAEVLVIVMVMVCLSSGKVTQCSVGVIIKVPKLSKASISCPSMANSSDLRYLLHFNGSCICQISLSEDFNSAYNLFSGHFEVTAETSGVYICNREVIYPPPYSVDCHTTELIVAEKQFFPAKNDTVPAANQSCPVRSPFIPETVMWAGCCVLLVYSLSVTCIIIVIWRKLKRDKEDKNVYVNTRPREFNKPCKA